MKSSKQYWGIFIMVSILIGITIMLVGGFFDRNNNISDSNEVVNIIKKNVNLQKTKSEDNDIEQLKKIDLADSNVDFEADSLDFDDDSADIKDLDDDLDLSSVDSEVY